MGDPCVIDQTGDIIIRVGLLPFPQGRFDFGFVSHVELHYGCGSAHLGDGITYFLCGVQVRMTSYYYRVSHFCKFEADGSANSSRPPCNQRVFLFHYAIYFDKVTNYFVHL